MKLSITVLILQLLAAGHPGATGPAEARSAPSAPVWDARAAEHLLDRAAFGARPAEIEAAVRAGRDAFVASLFRPLDPDFESFYVDERKPPSPAELGSLTEDQRKARLRDRVRDDREQLASFAGWWIERMLRGEDPLRERLTLFWHGYFTSSMRDVRSSAALIRQNELFRTHALGSFADLLHAIVRDPAMLAYLNNNQNRKKNPNENFAREIMELFSLGEGNYTENDVKEAARALTGWIARDDRAEFIERAHDQGQKTILGVSANFDADAFVDLLLEQPACATWVARKLLSHFEGREPASARLADYAAFLKSHEYRIDAFLKRLFVDPAFYADDVVGTRIAGPIEYLVGTSRRLGVEPPPMLVWLAAGQIGQRLFDPPNVKGWEGGPSWITTSTLMQRGNLAGVLLGVVKFDDLSKPEMDEESAGDSEEPTMTDGSERGSRRGARGFKRPIGARGAAPELGAMRRMLGELYRPAIHLTQRCLRARASTDAELVNLLSSELLPVALTETSRRALCQFLGDERAKLGLADGHLVDSVDGEDLLRRLAHLILSLPEAQLS